MKFTMWMALAVALTALAGCTEGEAEPMLTEEDCAALGLVLGHKETMEGGNAMEPETEDADESMDEQGAEADESTEEDGEGGLRFIQTRQANETEEGEGAPEGAVGDEGSEEAEHNHGEHGEELACVPAGPPATLSLTMAESTMAYVPVDFEWMFNTDATEELHSMDTQVRVSSESIGDDALGMPDTYGDMVAQFEHQNFVDGQTYTGSFQSEEPGMFYFRAYAVVNGENLWSEEAMFEVTPVVESGVSHDVTCTNGGAPSFGTCAPSELTIELGDAVAWLNGNQGGVGSWTITKASGPESQDIATTAGGAAVALLVPGSYTYQAEGDLGTVSGSITVTLPTA